MKIRTLLTSAALLAFASVAQAQLIISSLNSTANVTFDATVSGVFNVGFATSSGFAQTPVSGSPYDSDAWAARVGGSGNFTLPATGTSTTGAVGFTGNQSIGAVSRGVNPTAGFTAGLGIVTGTPTGNATAFRPEGTGTDNAALFLRIQNTTGQTVSSWTLSYLAYYIDIGTGVTPGTFSYSTDNGATFSTNVSSLGFTTPGTGTVTTPTTSDWTLISGLSGNFSASVSHNSYLILRWSLGQDIVAGAGNRVALDNISITAVPEPATWALLAAGLTTLVVVRRRRRG